MNKKELIDKLIQNENSPFSEADIKTLNGLPDDTLRKIILSTPQIDSAVKKESTVKNEAADEQSHKAIIAGKQALKAVQKQIFELRATEAKALDDLDRLGVTEKSIFNVDYSAISEDDIHMFVQNSQSEVAQILREALEIRNRGRADLVSQVIVNSGGLFSEEDLQSKTSEELRKLATLSGNSSQQGSMSFQGAAPVPLTERDGTALNWRGAGIGNIPIMNEVGGGEPLGLPTTFTPNNT